MGSTSQFLQLLQTLLCLGLVQGHGRLIDPPSRSSMWRFGFPTPVNYNDNQLFCGGVGIQYSAEVGGKCGVCGDPWNGPRENEVGGKYATGMIGRKYKVGQVIDAVVDLTANHKGYFEFRLCQKDDPNQRATWDCMNKHLLVDNETGLTRYAVKYISYSSKFIIKLRLPKNVKCKACVLQWKYNAGNSWGVGKDGKGCVGCGNQEQFYGCADVAIGYDAIKEGDKDDSACAYKEVGEYQWQWDCTGKKIDAEEGMRKTLKGVMSGAIRDSPFLIGYFISFMLVAMHNVLMKY